MAEEKGSEESSGSDGGEGQITDAEAQGDLDLDLVFAEPDESPGETEDKSSADASDKKDGQGSEETAKTEEERVTAEAADKEAYEKMSAEEKVVADKAVTDKTEADLKAAYEKLSPEERKVADSEKATREAAEAETTRVSTEHADALAKSEKRRSDTERWAQQLNQTQLDLQREVHILKRQAADPDYDPENDESLREVGPTEEQKAAASERKGRAGASLEAAYGKYGKDVTEKGLTEYKELFAGDTATQQQVMAAKMPVEEALGLVKLSHFFSKWGQDPDAIEQRMRDEVTKELTPKIRDEESKRIMADLKKTTKLPKGLSDLKGDNQEGNKRKTEPDGTMEAVFDNQ